MNKIKDWGIFISKEEKDNLIDQLESANLEVFEVREVTFIEKLLCASPTQFTDELWIVMFKATSKEYRKFVRNNDLVSVF